MRIRVLLRFNHGIISIFEIRERKGRMCVWNQVNAAPSSRMFVSIVLRIGRVSVATHSCLVGFMEPTGACWSLLWSQ